MSTQAHSLGPWTCDPTREFAGVKWDKIVRSAHNDPICSIYVAGYASAREPKANARLIAAAPTMLAALKTAEEAITHLSVRSYYIGGRQLGDILLDAINAAEA